MSQELDLAKHFGKPSLIMNVFMKEQAAWCGQGGHLQFKLRLGVLGMLDEPVSALVLRSHVTSEKCSLGGSLGGQV